MTAATIAAPGPLDLAEALPGFQFFRRRVATIGNWFVTTGTLEALLLDVGVPSGVEPVEVAP